MLPLRFVLLAAVLSAALPSVAAEMGAGRASPSVAVVLDFDNQYSPDFLDGMERELETILRPCSVNLMWRILDDSTALESFSNLVVARFKGRCSTGEAHQETEEETRTLGFTHVSDGEILPFSEVDCDKVRSFVEPEIAGEARTEGERLLGRALGRIMAHELYHILAHSSAHAVRGIAKPMLTAKELVRGRLKLERNEETSIRKALTPGPDYTRLAAK